MKNDNLLNVRLVRWYNGNGPMQINVVCTNCLSAMGTCNIHEIVIWAEKHKCPLVMPIAVDENGNLNLSDLIRQLENKND